MKTSSTKALLFDIQRFSIHDGPGIRTTLFFKGCPLRCLWCQNPESHKAGPEIAFYWERCLGCFACREVCPEKAVLDEETQRIKHAACTACGRCVSACPNEALRMMGVEWEAPALLAEVLKDQDYFEDSGGGITLSGGEPLLQAAFLDLFLPLVRREGIHVTMETSGLCSWETVESLLPFLDLVYFDLKCLDTKKHRTFTGSFNELILDNFSRLAAVFPHLEARMPLVPSINDEDENIQATARFLRNNRKERIHLLRYHTMGEAKLERIETELRPLNLRMDAGEALLRAKKVFESEGIIGTIYE
jgi:pyruvate formate lyase activating enzyme